jgi:hypothetical protein
MKKILCSYPLLPTIEALLSAATEAPPYGLIT